MEATKSNYYYCSECHSIIKRESRARRIKSICDKKGKNVFLTKIKNADELAIKLREVFLKNEFTLEAFTPTQLMFLERAFEQGVKVVFNGLR